jgi:magnesium chelatase subunit H
LIQDIHSWTRQGIGGLQSVVLYALPELDGAIDPVPLGGLVGEEDLSEFRNGCKRLIGGLKAGLPYAKTGIRKENCNYSVWVPTWVRCNRDSCFIKCTAIASQISPRTLKEQGYNVGDLPEDGEELIRR